MTFLSLAASIEVAKLIFNGRPTTGAGQLWTNFNVNQGTSSTGSYLYLSLHTSNPTDAGQSSEPTVGQWTGYGRVAIPRYGSFTGSTPAGDFWQIAGAQSPSGSGTSWVVSVSNLISISAVPCVGGTGATIRYWGLYDAANNGNLVTYGPLKASGSSWKIGQATDVATGNIVCQAHALATNDVVFVHRVYNSAAGDIPSEFLNGTSDGQRLFVDVIDANTFRLKATIAGAAIVPTTRAAFLFIKSGEVPVSVGSVPTFAVSALTAARLT